jgi:hypothetical protein
VTRVTGILPDYLFISMIISLWILLTMRNVSGKILEKIKTHFIFNKFFRKSCRLWNNVVKYCTAWQATDDNIIWHMRIACWINKATNTHTDCVILNVFPLQQLLHERASILRNTYIACLLLLSFWYIPVLIQPLSPIIHLNVIYKRKDSIHAKETISWRRCIS